MEFREIRLYSLSLSSPIYFKLNIKPRCLCLIWLKITGVYQLRPKLIQLKMQIKLWYKFNITNTGCCVQSLTQTLSSHLG